MTDLISFNIIPHIQCIHLLVLHPAYTRHRPNVDVMWGQRRRRWAGIKATLGPVLKTLIQNALIAYLIDISFFRITENRSYCYLSAIK